MEQKAMQSERETYRRQRKNKKSKVEVLTEAQKIAFAPMTFQALAALIDFNILQTISQTPLTREEVMQKCNLSKYTVYTLFDAALYAGLIKKDEQGAYSATDLGEAFLLDPMTKANFNFIKDVCYLGAHELKESFAKNTPVGLQKHYIDSKTIYEVLPQLPQQMLKSWYEFDHYYSDDCFGEVLKIMFNQKPSKVFDIGGNTGKFERACLAFDSECEVNMIDLPPNIEVAKAKFEQEKADFNRLKFHALDILKQENNLPEMTGSDVKNTIVLMSQFLDCFSEEQILHILNKVGEKINEYTRVYILEPFIDNQLFTGAAYSLAHISLYFTCMANGCSKMYNEADMKDIIKKSNLKVNRAFYNIGKYDYTLLECIKA